MFSKNQEAKISEFEVIELEAEAVDAVSGACRSWFWGAIRWNCHRRH
ncbi:MAG: hypothetical protein ACK5LJ_10960 [Paracoccus sp. (in: a-proteobacteria)]